MGSSSRNLLALLLLSSILLGHCAPSFRRSRAAKLLTDGEQTTRHSKLTNEFKDSTTTAAPPTRNNRKNKALNLFGYFPSFLSSGLDYNEDDDDDVTFSVNDDHYDEEDLSRTIPGARRPGGNKRKNGNGNGNGNNGNYQNQNENLNSLQYDNSPIFYIRLPPTPYMFVPGLGYVSQPPSLGPSMGPPAPQVDPFINLPLDFVSNGKPTGVYQWGGAPQYAQVPQYTNDPYGFGQPMMPQQPPRPTYNPTYEKPKKPSNSKVTNLKGQYAFNGKPGDSVYVLRDTYNSIYSDALQNFYP